MRNALIANSSSGHVVLLTMNVEGATGNGVAIRLAQLLITQALLLAGHRSVDTHELRMCSSSVGIIDTRTRHQIAVAEKYFRRKQHTLTRVWDGSSVYKAGLLRHCSVTAPPLLPKPNY